MHQKAVEIILVVLAWFGNSIHELDGLSKEESQKLIAEFLAVIDRLYPPVAAVKAKGLMELK